MARIAICAPSMLGQVYNSNNDYMVEKGFDTANVMVELVLPKTKIALEDWIAQYEELIITTNKLTRYYL